MADNDAVPWAATIADGRGVAHIPARLPAARRQFRADSWLCSAHLASRPCDVSWLRRLAGIGLATFMPAKNATTSGLSNIFPTHDGKRFVTLPHSVLSVDRDRLRAAVEARWQAFSQKTDTHARQATDLSALVASMNLDASRRLPLRAAAPPTSARSLPSPCIGPTAAGAHRRGGRWLLRSCGGQRHRARLERPPWRSGAHRCRAVRPRRRSFRPSPGSPDGTEPR